MFRCNIDFWILRPTLAKHMAQSSGDISDKGILMIMDPVFFELIHQI